MHVHFEQNTCTRTESTFLSLSWMGKVPEDLPEAGGGWKLNRAQYYVEGWLASGNTRGIVGVTFSTSHCHRHDAPPRSNFNLRGHRSEVMLVRWNEPYQKLATCDVRGIIFVWTKHEGRWSIELINDRSIQVTDFAWSHDGRMALICYRDSFILVGSVAGQRYWSSMLHMDNTTITCGLWSPDDQQVMFGTLDGQIIVMSSTGTVVTQISVHEGHEITGMAWSCERFNMEEAETNRDSTYNGSESSPPKQHVLAVSFKYGEIFLMSNYDDPSPITIYTALTDVKMDWSNCGEYLAVGGFVRQPNLECRNEVRFYAKDGTLVHWVPIPSQGKPLSAMTWGHNDKRLFVAAGCHMYVAWVSKQVAPLNFLCQRIIHQSVKSYKAVEKLPIPQRLKCGVKALFSPTIKSYIPEPLHLREFVCWPPPGGERLFCTMVRHGEENSGGHYTLYLEYLGGLVPLLKGKRASKLRPDFIIFDPKIKSSGKADQNQQGNTIESDSSSESDAGVITDGCGSPRMQRRRRPKVFRAEKVNRSITFRTLDELMFDDNLPENNRLVEVTSNIWGTKFQITGVGSSLPACLGQIVYKTSLLHLQPRQMTITIGEISPSRPLLSRDPNFTPAPVSDDDDSFWTSDGDFSGERTVEVAVHDTPAAAVISHGSAIDPAVALARVNGGGVPIADATAGIIGSRNQSGSSPLIEHSCPDSTSTGSKHGSPGSSVRLRSMSPVRNSLTHSSPVHMQDAQIMFNNNIDNINRQENNSIAWQGARPKINSTNVNSASNNNNSNNNGGGSNNNSPKSNTKNNRYSSGSSSSSNNTTNATTTTCSPKLTHVGNYKCAAVNSTGINSSNSNPSNSSVVNNNSTTTNQYASSNGIISALPPSSNNRVEAYPTISTNSSSNGRSKKVELISGFKRLELNSVVDNKGGNRGGGGGGVGGGGRERFAAFNSVWKQESSADASKDSPEEIPDPKSGPFIGDTLVSPVRPTAENTPIALRWADPASQSVKLMDEDGVDVAELPFESNLVADCSPTAPLSLDLQRRLYLAHQHVIETGAPISPTSCPSCLPPAQRSALATSASGSNDVTYDVTHYSTHRNGLHGAVTVNSSCTKGQNIRSSVGSNSQLQPNNSSLNVCKTRGENDIVVTRFDNGATATSSSSLLLPRSPSSSLTSSSSLSSSSSSRKSSKEEITYSSSCHADASNNALTSHDSHQQPPPTSSNLHSTLTTISTTVTQSTSSPPQPTSQSSSSPSLSPSDLPKSKFHSSTSSIPGHSFFRSPITTPTTPLAAPMMSSANHDHSTSSKRSPHLPSDRTSSEKLAHLLSEDPLHNSSSHNIQSMPGFVMMNPSNPQQRYSAKEDSLHSSPERCNSNSDSSNNVNNTTHDNSNNLNLPFYSHGVSQQNNTFSYDMPCCNGDGVMMPDVDIRQISASLPTSPIRFGMKKENQTNGAGGGGGGVGVRGGMVMNENFINGKCKHLSPLLQRRGKNGQCGNQDPNMYMSMELPQGYHSLEAFQKAQLRQKMRRKSAGPHSRFDQGRTFIMHNKAPLWNETSQVYQLDFGGRVTQESAKNFQIELRGKQVMQFGRINNNAYTLDFQYPFTAVQAFAVALANVTQRLK